MNKQTLRSSFKNALVGIFFTIKSQRNMKLHLVSTCIIAISGFLLKISLIEWTSICLAIGLVLTMEIINTAIEECVNLITTEKHPHAKHAKDAAAGATLIAAFVATLIGLLIFGPKVTYLLKGLSL